MISYSISLSQDRLLNEQFCDMYLDIESKVNPFLINYNKFKMDSKSNINNETAQVFFFYYGWIPLHLGYGETLSNYDEKSRCNK